MKLMGIDYGSKKVGIALTDAVGTMAFPKTVMMNDEMLVRNVRALAQTERVGAIVIGDTRTARGEENDVTQQMEHFSAALQRATMLPIHFMREDGTTGAAGAREEGAARGETTFPEHSVEAMRDARAAAIILERYLAIHKTESA